MKPAWYRCTKCLVTLGWALAPVLAAGLAQASGLERNALSPDILFEPGRQLRLDVVQTRPSVSGVSVPGGISTGDVGRVSTRTELAIKWDAESGRDYALLVDQPISGDVRYPDATGYPLAGGQATLDSDVLRFLIRQPLNAGWSLLGGASGIRLKGAVTLPLATAAGGRTFYRVTAEGGEGVAGFVGLAWERPELAQRVSLVYETSARLRSDAIERSAVFAGLVPDATIHETISVTLPQSLTLAARTGLPGEFLLFGSVRWADWTRFQVDPEGFRLLTGRALIDYDEDLYRFNAGIGKQLSDHWGVALSGSIQRSSGGVVSDLGPTDGSRALGAIVSYRTPGYRLSLGAYQLWLGDATTRLGRFSDNQAQVIAARYQLAF